MKSIKCPNCGLMNFETQSTCKRCNVSLNFYASTQDTIHNDSQNIDNPMVITRTQEILIGIASVLAGLFIFVMNWMSAVYSKNFHASITILGPVTVAFGLCFLLIPYPQKQYFPKAEFAPKSWAFFIISAFILGALNWLYFMGIA